jgi:hypothetical protein
MNARPASASAAVAHRSGLVVAAVATCRAVLRVPLAPQALPIAGAFLCSYLLYGRIAGDGTAPGWNVLGGIASLLALFALLRLVDDLDDLERDHPAGRCSAARRSALRSRLIAGIWACIALVVVLNVTAWHALVAAAAATALVFAGPFGFKPLFPRRLALGSAVFEGAPFLIFAYCYFFWRSAGGPALPFLAASSVAGLFWAGYEFWKFSRKVHSAAMQPYFLAPRGIRLALNALLVLALAANLAVARFAGLSNAYTIYAAALPVGWLVWLNGAWPAAASEQGGIRRPLWAGMSFVGALELGLLVELLPMPGSR